jgi:metal-responsive CopG/Arc/MetJ family transcriptional regulator
MKMTRIMIQLPGNLKNKLDALRKQGTTASGFIRNLVSENFIEPPSRGAKGDKPGKGGTHGHHIDRRG